VVYSVRTGVLGGTNLFFLMLGMVVIVGCKAEPHDTDAEGDQGCGQARASKSPISTVTAYRTW